MFEKKINGGHAGYIYGVSDYNSNEGEYTKPCNGISRGDIWRVSVNRLTGNGYGTFIVVSSEEENSEKPYVIMVSVVDSLRGKPRDSRFSIQLGAEKKYVVCETIKRVDGNRLVEYVGKISPEEIKKLNSALAYTVGISVSDDDYKEKYDAVVHDIQSLADSLNDEPNPTRKSEPMTGNSTSGGYSHYGTSTPYTNYSGITDSIMH